MSSLAATPRVFVCRFLAGICIAVYVLMVLRGVSPFLPTVEDLLKWGADFGPAIALEGQSWRLFTNVFLHVGIIHLTMNMWCFLAFGPLIERLYGNAAFAALYLLAGVGGSIASMAWNPILFSAGASGAIFGVIGALLAFVVVHRHAIPVEVLVPLRSSAVSFTVMNLMLGLMVRGIDNAAHIGGLLTGFLAGVLMQRHWPPSQDRWATPRQLLVGALIAGAMLLAIRPLEARIRRTPEVIQVLDQEQARQDYNAFITGLRPCLAEYNAVERDIQSAFKEWNKTGPGPDANRHLADRLDAQRSRAERNQRAATTIPAAQPGLKTARDHFLAAQSLRLQSLTRLAQAAAPPAPCSRPTPIVSPLPGPRSSGSSKPARPMPRRSGRTTACRSKASPSRDGSSLRRVGTAHHVPGWWAVPTLRRFHFEATGSISARISCTGGQSLNTI